MSEAIISANELTDTERLSSISQVRKRLPLSSIRYSLLYLLQVSGHQYVLVACGDSFVGPLTLLNNRKVLVKKFSGASAKVSAGDLHSATNR